MDRSPAPRGGRRLPRKGHRVPRWNGRARPLPKALSRVRSARAAHRVRRKRDQLLRPLPNGRQTPRRPRALAALARRLAEDLGRARRAAPLSTRPAQLLGENAVHPGGRGSHGGPCGCLAPSMDDSSKPRGSRDISEEPTGVRRQAPLDATMPPSSSMQMALPGTEDAIMSATPVCDRGTLTMVSGSEAGAVYRLGESTVLGRSQDCEVRINDVGVSRRHALIVQQSGTDYVVQDLGSRNGTTVRG